MFIFAIWCRASSYSPLRKERREEELKYLVVKSSTGALGTDLNRTLRDAISPISSAPGFANLANIAFAVSCATNNIAPKNNTL
jgi:hypothetical protein